MWKPRKAQPKCQLIRRHLIPFPSFAGRSAAKAWLHALTVMSDRQVYWLRFIAHARLPMSVHSGKRRIAASMCAAPLTVARPLRLLPDYPLMPCGYLSPTLFNCRIHIINFYEWCQYIFILSDFVNLLRDVRCLTTTMWSDFLPCI